MDLNLVDPSEVPLPPDEVRIRRFDVAPFGDGRRLKVDIDLTPFQRPPTLHVSLRNGGTEVASTSIVEAVSPRMSFTMHLREGDLTGPFEMLCIVEYIDGPKVDEKALTLQLD